jgi:hypothetical protein
VRRPAAVAVAVLVALGLIGCTAAQVSPTVGGGSASAPASAPLPAASASGAPGTTGARARQELARFDAVNRRTARRTDAGGRDFVDALVAAGYPRGDLQVTEDRTTIGLPVPSVQFSVLWRGVCLVGQHGPRSGGYRGLVVEPIDGRCLIGRTRPIDW